MDNTGSFAEAFSGLTGYTPFRWQQRLYGKLVAGCIPARCDLPTGLGKTSVIPIWLIALARGRANIPRRLVYVVNRRTVVDQATDEAVRLSERLSNPPPERKKVLDDLRQCLAALSGDDGNPLAVSTLRGELADNGDWKANPTRPAIVIGTVDMIGSKLLFQGYGDSRYWRPHHAGLIGQDTLIVHDEAHLTPAFGHLVREIASLQSQDQSHRPIRILELSATSPPGRPKGETVFSLEPQDEEDTTVRNRLHAKKWLTLHHDAADRTAVVQKLLELALGYRGKNCRVLVYVSSPDDAQTMHNALVKVGVPDKHVALLTGTLRGHERDKLVKTPIFAWFRGGQPMNETAYLVSTSAGEVGVDLDADHMVCDLSTLESMIQRLGRVNRKPDKAPNPEEKVADVDVVAEESVIKTDGKPAKGEPEALFKARQKTWEALSQLPLGSDGRRDASPLALRKIAAKPDAWSPPPVIPPLTDILLDAWALTSLGERLPARPAVEDWLHGINEAEPPETYVAWRAELAELARADISQEVVAEALMEKFPIRSAERLRDRTDRVREELGKVAARAVRDEELTRLKAIVIRGDNAVWIPLSELSAQKLDYATVVLPVEAGGLKDGYLKGDERAPADDVAEVEVKGQPPRQRVLINADGTEDAVCGDQVQQSFVTRFHIRLRDDEFAVEGGEAGPTALEYRTGPADAGERLGAAESQKPVRLKDHTPAVVEQAKRLAGLLHLPTAVVEAIELAAQWHDRGKARTLWQRAAGNSVVDEPLAKAGKHGVNWRALQGYRHELGSLLEAANDPAIREHPESDLILHLIAAHHGWARPHFEPNALDNSDAVSTQDNHHAIAEAMRRYARLQQRFGRWGLAWLEALLRCADGLASAHPEGEPKAPAPSQETRQ